MSELEIWNELGNIYYNAGAFDEAIRAYHRAIELDHGCGQSFCNLADIYIRKEFYDEAILMYLKGIDLLKNPLEKVVLLTHLGDVYLHLNRHGEAIQAYQAAVGLDPDNPELQEALANVIASAPSLSRVVETPVSDRPTEYASSTSEESAEESVREPTAQNIESLTEETEMEDSPATDAPSVERRGAAEESFTAVETFLDHAFQGAPVPAQEIPGETVNEILPEGPILVVAENAHDPLVEENDLETVPPLPAEFRDEEALEADPCATAVQKDELEAEAALRLAALLSERSSTDLQPNEAASAAWMFQQAPGIETVTEESGPVEKSPIMLGGRLLVSPVTLEKAPAAELSQPLAETAEAPLLVHVPPFVEMDEDPSTDPKPLAALVEETESKATGTCQDLSGLLAEALPTDFEIPFRQVPAERNLPAIEPKMGEPMNSRASALVKLGLRRWHQNDFEGAIQFLKTALNLAGVFFDRPFEALCHHAIALVETDMGNPQEALVAYENATRLDPEHCQSWKNMGYLYSKNSRYEEALDAFKKAIEQVPNDPMNWNGLGDVYHKLGRGEDAIAAYQLGNVFDRQNREIQRTEPATTPFEPGSHHPRVLEEMGNINFLHSAFDDAIHAYSDAIELLESPTDKARLWRRLGDAYQRLHEDDNAKAAYQQAFAFDRGILPLQKPEPRSEPSPVRPFIEETIEEETDSAEAEATAPEDEYVLPEAEPAVALEAGPTAAAEPEAAYWFFKARSAAKPSEAPTPEPSRSSEGYRQEADTHLGAVKPSPAFVLPSYSGPTRLDKPLAAEAFNEAGVILMEETNEVEAEPMLDPVQIHVLAEEETRPISVGELDGPSLTEQEIDEMEGREFEANASATDGEEAARPDARTLENDIVAYRRVTELNPLNDRAWDALGNMYEATGLHSEAIAAFEKAISLASQREVYHYHLGLAYAAQKHYDKAIQSLQKVVALNPDYVLAHCALAGYYRRLGKEAEAREHAVIARPFMESENYYNQACFESICGNIDRAFAFLQNALEKKQVDIELARTDPDLDFIREDSRFEALLGKKDAEGQVTP